MFFLVPRYVLDPTARKAKVGEDIYIKFSIIKDPQSGKIGEHSLKKENLKYTAAKIENNQIIFQNLKVEDSGTYEISCRNEVGEGCATFVLAVEKGRCLCILTSYCISPISHLQCLIMHFVYSSLLT